MSSNNTIIRASGPINSFCQDFFLKVDKFLCCFRFLVKKTKKIRARQPFPKSKNQKSFFIHKIWIIQTALQSQSQLKWLIKVLVHRITIINLSVLPSSMATSVSGIHGHLLEVTGTSSSPILLTYVYLCCNWRINFGIM